MAIKILVITPDAKDANSFWRCMGPLSYLGKSDDIEVTLWTFSGSGFSWVEFEQHDIIFLHRPCTRDHVIAMQIAYNLNKPVWVDFDDWLFQIPGWNPHAGMYHSAEFQTSMALCIAAADVVSVTTAELYNQYSKVNKNVVIIPNAYRSDIFTYRKAELQPREDFAIWRGSNTHDGDLLSVRQGFIALNNKTMFMGNPSWLLLSGMNPAKVDVKVSNDVLMYFKYIYDQRPKVFVFPLVDCLFNRCKSNIAYIEAMHAGAICVAPDLPEWRREGVITYPAGDSASFTKAVHEAFEISPQDHAAILESAFDSMKLSYDISIINDIRRKLVFELHNEPPVKKDPFDQMLGLSALSILRGKKQNDEEGTTTSSGVSREVLASVLR